MKKFGFIIIFLIFTGLLFTGCTHEMVSLYIYKMPNKLVYEIGEEIDLSGLELKNIKTDSALIKIYNNNASISGFDSETSGKKEVTISYGDFTTSFTVYVANKVVRNSAELTSAILDASDEDIILVKQGEYKIEKPIEINNSKLVLGGEGAKKSKIDGFFVLGGYFEDGEINYTNGATDITLINLGFNILSEEKNNIISFKNANYNYNLGCINADVIKNLKVIGCNFTGFCRGIKINELENSFISGNTFTELFIGGIEVTNSTLNSTFSKNIINNIGKNIVFTNENKEQDFIFGIKLAFKEEGNVGVSVYKNSISKIAINDNSKGQKFLLEKTNGAFTNLNYMKNSSGIIIHSSGKNNLTTTGISIFFNSMGSSLNNILYNTTDDDRINSSSVNYMSF